MDKLGGGERILFRSRLVIIGDSKILSVTSYEVLNKINFPTFTFTNNLSPVITFDETSGIFEFKTSGILKLTAVMNIITNQAASIIYMIPEFDIGGGWFTGTPRKEVCVAIQCGQISWSGELKIQKGNLARFNFKGESGNLQFVTAILDPGGPLECVLPSAVFYIDLYREIIQKFN